VPETTCTDCERTRKHYARGLCNTCYKKRRLAGELGDALRRKSVPFEQRLAASAEGRTADECWPWSGRIQANGYPGSVGRATAYRRAWELVNGPVPAGFEIDHACHSMSPCRLGTDCPHRRCVNPAHLRLATRRQNALWTVGRRGDPNRTPCEHPRNPEFGYVRPNGAWRCRPCHNLAKRLANAKAAGRRPAPAKQPLSPDAANAQTQLRLAVEQRDAAQRALETAARAALSQGLSMSVVSVATGYSWRKIKDLAVAVADSAQEVA
jgi:hypothetical protein